MTTARSIPAAGASIFRLAKRRITNISRKRAPISSRRHFFALFSPSPSPSSPESPPTTTLSARRILPYPVASVFSLIANVDSYQTFLPNCQRSHVTAWADPVPADAHEGHAGEGALPGGPQQQQQRYEGRTGYHPQAQSPPPQSSTSSFPPLPSSQPPGHNGNNNSIPDRPRTRYPALADLTVGWGPFHESYTSRVYCVPFAIVEALSGRARTAIPAHTLLRYGYGPHLRREEEEARARQAAGQAGQAASDLFASLVTRWTVRPVTAGGAAGRGVENTRHSSSSSSSSSSSFSAPAKAGAGGEQQWTEASLAVTFQFQNPAMGHAVRLMGRHKIDEMVHAFEQQARRLCGRT